MKRYDYRNDYKNWTKDEMKKHLPILQDKLLQELRNMRKQRRRLQ